MAELLAFSVKAALISLSTDGKISRLYASIAAARTVSVAGEPSFI